MLHIINVGGLTARSPNAGTVGAPSMLSKSMEKFLADARRGFVVISFGSMISHLPPVIAEKFIDAFHLLRPDFNIVWRFNVTDQPQLAALIPDNVLAGSS